MATDADKLENLKLAEAAAWLTELQGNAREPETEAAFRLWLAKPSHAAAFSKVTSIWEIIPGAAKQADRRPKACKGPLGLTAVVAVLVFACVMIASGRPQSTFVSRAGQQLNVDLSDRSRIFLNTDTQVSTRYSLTSRDVYLSRGEALFYVAKDVRRPFIVHVGDARVRALGTKFVVKSTPSGVAVSLIAGRVEVSERKAGVRARKLAILRPGDQLKLSREGVAIGRIDTESVTAWRQQQIVFEDVRLAAAAAEFTPYGGPPIRIEDPRVAELRVSGTFRVDDPLEFASAVGQLHRLRVKPSEEGILVQP